MAADASVATSDAAEPAKPPARAERASARGRTEADPLRGGFALVYRVDPTDFERLTAEARLGGPARLSSANETREYFDTEFGDLGRAGFGVSLRRTRGRLRQALHAGGGPAEPFTTAICEVPIDGETPAPERFPAAVARLVAKATEGRALAARYRVEMRRGARTLSQDGATFEIVFRKGEIVAGSQRETLREIEIVLKSGAPVALYRFGHRLTEIGLTRLAVEPREAWALRLATGTPPPLARSAAPDFGPETALDEAIGALLRNGLQQFLGNGPAMQGDDAGVAVHQIRVSLRRLRSALGLLRPMFASAELEALRAEAKAIADAFTDAREWDVFGAMVAKGPRAALPELPGFATLMARAREQTAEGRARALRVLNGAATARFVLSLQAFIAARGWRNAVPDDEVQTLAAPAAEFATRALERLYRRVRKRGRDFAELDPEPRHRLRIALKQLRYACEFFSPLYGSPGATRGFARACADLQDILGLANDVAVARHLVARLDLKGDPALSFAAGAVVGWCGHGARLDAATLRRDWRTFRKAEPFWRDEADRIG